MIEIIRMAHLIMIAMVTGMLVSHYVMLRAGVRLTGEAAGGLALARQAVAGWTGVVIVLVWITGLSLLWSRYETGAGDVNAWFYAKFACVLTLTGAYILQRLTDGRPAGAPALARRVQERWVSLGWLAALLAICFAVISFAR